MLDSAGRHRIRRALLGAGAIAGMLAGAAGLAPAAQARAIPVADGVLATPDGSGFAWQIRVERTALSGTPGLCFELDHSWDPEGTSFGNVATSCVAGSVDGRFSLKAGTCRGVSLGFGAGSIGDRRIRKLGVAAPRRARTVRVAFRGGQKVTLRTHRAPRALRRPVRLAWHVDGGEAGPVRAVARNGKGRVVGRWKPGLGC